MNELSAAAQTLAPMNSWAMVALALGKCLVAVLFLLNMAALTVWADRRQSAMVQDRVGPNRAVVYLPSTAVRIVLMVTATLVAALLAIPSWAPAPGLDLPRMTQGVEIAILVGWFGLMLLSAQVRRDGPDNAFDEMVASVEPRNYFYGGLVVHLVAALLVQVAPRGADLADVQWGPGLAGSLAAAALLASGFYAAAKVPEGRVPLRAAGTLHALADAIKLIWKEDLRPKNADKLLYALAPLLAMIPALVTFAVVPMGSTMCFNDVNHNGALEFGELGALATLVDRSGVCAPGQLPVSLAIADLNVGLLYVFAIAGTGIIGAAIAGWASDNKWALLGGLRATSQMVSYEVAMGLSITGMLMITSAVHMHKIVEWQGQHAWGIFVQPVAFFLFLAALAAETKRVPFDQPEGESEIIAGYFLEYSGMKFGLFFMGEYAEFVFSSALLVTLFFGGYHLPFLEPDGVRVALGSSVLYELKLTHAAVTLLHVATFFGKTVLLTWLQVFIRWTLPRFRYDQLMRLGWTKLLPLALGNILVTGIVILAVDAAGPRVLDALETVGDLTQALVALAGMLGAVALVTWLLEPSKPRRVAVSSTARYALEEGGVKAGKMGA
jgi:NADH-quinone oxidoreductase subunit H